MYGSEVQQKKSLELVKKLPLYDVNSIQKQSKHSMPKLTLKPSDDFKIIPLDPTDPFKCVRIGSVLDPK